MANNNRAINALVSSGADAFANTFDVKIKLTGK